MEYVLYYNIMQWQVVLVRVIKNKFSNVSYTLNGTYRLIMLNLTTCT